MNRERVYFSTIKDINNNWEMGVGKNHFKLVTSGNTIHHVSDGTSDGA